MRLRLPAKVTMILDILHRHGYEAYAVGGCVRDMVLARTPNDWDITTTATPSEVKAVFRRTVDTGIKHGTVTVLIDDQAFEVTTYRVDGTYSDGRHPDSVTFTTSLQEDLKRRDFTINAMAYNDKMGLVDLYGGMRDLQRHVIRCVGSPDERFDEDALRILRAVRFAAQLNFKIDPDTLKAIITHATELKKVSAERIQTEIVKLLVSDHPMMWRVLYETGITAVILPEFDVCMTTPQHSRHHCYGVGEHILHTLPMVPPDKILRLTMLLHDIAKPKVHRVDSQGIDHFKGHAKASADMAYEILKRWKFDNDTIDKVTRLIRWHDLRPKPDDASVRFAIYTVGKDLFADYLTVQTADNLAKSRYHFEEKMARIEAVNKTYIRILGRQDPLSLRDLNINGNDLLKEGLSGREVGNVLGASMLAVLQDPRLNRRDLLLIYARERRGKGPMFARP